MDRNFKPKLSREDYGWHSRGYLPHLDGEEFAQFITFRLFDSMPQEVLDRWRKEAAADSLFRRRVETYLDSGHGHCWLHDERIAHIVQNALLFHAGTKYDLLSWVIMPNHGHVALRPYKNVHLPGVLHSIKSFTAQEANRILNRKGQFWQHESFDRYIRNRRHYVAVVRYIEQNPVKAGLCRNAEDWRFGSAYYRRVNEG